MGCNYSQDYIINKGRSICFSKDENITSSISSVANFNEFETDLSHFDIVGRPIGLGGFGMVRTVTKLSGCDTGCQYAMKSMDKKAILKRSSGPS